MAASFETHHTRSQPTAFPPMTAQEKINQLANAALRAGPPPATAPKPATFMPSFEKLKSAEFVAATATAPAQKSVQPGAKATPAVEKVATPIVAAPVEETESEADLRKMLEARDAKKEQKTKRASLAVTCTIVGLLAGAGIWFATSESARAKAGYVVKSIRECGQDVKGVASIMGTYEKQLDKVAVQGSRIDAAASALGVDPTTTDTSAQAAEIESQMKEMSGDEGPTVSERDKALQAKFGIVSKLAGNKNPQVQKSDSDVKF
jgi:hypothetical protein